MTTFNLEPQELSLLIAALKTLMAAQPLTAFVLEPLIGKLENPPPMVETVVATKPASRAWTEAEDAVIRKYSEIMVPPVWASIQTDLPDRTINMIKSRYARLGLVPKAVTIPPGTFKASEPEPPLSRPAEALILEHPEPAPTESKPPAEPSPSMPIPEEPKATLATTENTEDWGWVNRGPSKEKLMSGR